MKDAQLHIKLDKELLRKLDARLKLTGVSRSEFVRRAITEKLEK